jgi:hypothetical protein
MRINLESVFGDYTREQLEESLRSIDPVKNPEDYAAVKAAIARALPAAQGQSCLDVAALRKLDALVQPSTSSKTAIIIAALIGIVGLVWRFIVDQTFDTPAAYWERVAVVMAVSIVLLVGALWRTSVNTYRFAGDTIRCIRLGKVAWGLSLSDLVWVEEIVSRGECCLDFHWPTSTRRVELQLSDFSKFGVVVS